MSKIERVSGRGIPLTGDDIDTDRVIPARFLRCVTFDGLGAQVFADDRAQSNGQHPFDLPQYQGANILVVNANFGCGSSREHAPQAIIKWGIQAIVGESFAEIFFGNCLANGVPCLTATPETVKQLQSLLQANPQSAISVDLTTMQVICGDFSEANAAPFRSGRATVSASLSLGDGARQMLVSGTWDSCGQLIQNAEAIQTTASKLPYVAWAS